jgi:outer membrane immunogenic protein
MQRFLVGVLVGVLGAVLGALALAATAPQAFAADVAVALPTKAPVKAAPVQPWRGFFIGVHGGYGWGNHPVVRVPDASYEGNTTLYADPIAGAPRGVIAGAQWGTNYQLDRFLVGTESDFSYADIKRAESIISGFFVSTHFSGDILRAGVNYRCDWTPLDLILGR